MPALKHNLPEAVSIKKWSVSYAPERILVIRIQALGDMFAMLPFISDLKEKYPNAKIDLLVREDYLELPSKMKLFDHVYPLKGRTSGRKQQLFLIGMLPRLFVKNYDVVLDLQRNNITRWLRRVLLPKAWTEFDRFSPKSVLLRYKWSVEQVGLGELSVNYNFTKEFRNNKVADELLIKNGWERKNTLVILNPAAAFITRNWEISRYIDFIRLWIIKEPETQFIFIGVETIKEKASIVKQEFPLHVIDLVNKTDISTAYSIVLKADFMLTEDSGLGHFSWMSGKKTLVLLGATRSDWTAPVGSHTACFNSSDLPCGDCMLAECKHSSVICMDRLTPEKVFTKAWELYQSDSGLLKLENSSVQVLN